MSETTKKSFKKALSYRMSQVQNPFSLSEKEKRHFFGIPYNEDR